MHDINLKAMGHFEAVARLGGVTRAAAELQVSPSAVSQQIRVLEQQYGVKLFNRLRQRLQLTLEGEQLFQKATLAFGMLRSARTTIAGPIGESLSIRVSPSIGERWLSRRLADFAEQNPHWDMRIDATPNFSDFAAEMVDLDLRYGNGNWPGLHAECVIEDHVLPLCSPAYRAKIERSHRSPEALIRHARLIESSKASIRWQDWLRRRDLTAADTASWKMERSSMAIQLAADGGGVILESMTLTMEEVETGQLVPLSPAFSAETFPAYWLVCPNRYMSRRPVNQFGEWLRTVAQRDQIRIGTILSEHGISTVSVGS